MSTSDVPQDQTNRIVIEILRYMLMNEKQIVRIDPID